MLNLRKTFLSLFAFFAIVASIIESSGSLHADSKFDIAMKTVIRHEGGLSNDKSDPGGISRYGISLRYLKGEHLDVNGDGKVDKEDIIHLTLTEADKIYYKDFYQRNHYDQIKDQHILTKILDFSINAGSYQCNKIVKRALNRILSSQMEVNGTLDDYTIKRINQANPTVLYSALVSEEENFYYAIVRKNRHLEVFLKGWLIRCND